MTPQQAVREHLIRECWKKLTQNIFYAPDAQIKDPNTGYQVLLESEHLTIYTLKANGKTKSKTAIQYADPQLFHILETLE